MQRKLLRTAAGCVSAALVAMPGAASAATKTVYAGGPPGVAKQIARTLPHSDALLLKNASPGIDGFRNSTVAINTGDTVQWQGLSTSFHDVDLPGSSGHDQPLFTGSPTQRVTGLKDAAGNPFWFNGKPALGFNPALFAPTGASTYDGSKRVDSGLPLGPPKPFKVTFTKPGTYVYFCDIHPGMKGYVVVRPKGQPVPSAAQDAKALHAQIKADVLSAVRLAKLHVASNTVELGQSDGNGVELYAMFPATVKVKPGTTVTFSMASRSREIHTASFGPAQLLNTLGNSFQGPAPDQRGSYASDNPALGTIQLSPSLHGNGFANTGLLDRDGSTPFPSSGRIMFTKRGTYHFICVVHSNMTGTIVVK